MKRSHASRTVSGLVKRTTVNGSGLETRRPMRRSSSHLGEEAMGSREEEADGEDEVGEKIHNFGTGHWSGTQRQMSGILVWVTGRPILPTLECPLVH